MPAIIAADCLPKEREKEKEREGESHTNYQPRNVSSKKIKMKVEN